MATTETVALEAPDIVTFALDSDPCLPGTEASKWRDACPPLLLDALALADVLSTLCPGIPGCRAYNQF